MRRSEPSDQRSAAPERPLVTPFHRFGQRRTACNVLLLRKRWAWRVCPAKPPKTKHTQTEKALFLNSVCPCVRFKAEA